MTFEECLRESSSETRSESQEETSSEITDYNPVSETISVCRNYHGSEII